MHPQGRDDEVAAGRPLTSVTPLANGGLPLRPGIQEAVNTAIDKSDSATVDPKLIAEITEQVLGALRAKGVTTAGAATSTRADEAATFRRDSIGRPQQLRTDPATSLPLHHPAPAVGKHIPPQSPTSPASSGMPARYTPPSPNRLDGSSYGSCSPEPQYSDPGSSASKETRGSRRDSKSSMSGQEDVSGSRHRRRPVRIPSDVEETCIEKAWQPLFEDGKPTPRLGQFLRGLAKHLIDDKHPQNSTVVTPGKLSNFFEDTKLRDELFPWVTIFGGLLTNVAISKLFLHLRCQHHLIQFHFHDCPSIPGLTPLGFEQFMTTLILAYPDQEFQRLDKATRNMPVSNADNPTERFPKQLTRRLFPISGDPQHQQRLTAVLASEPAVQLNHPSQLPPPPPTLPPQSSNSTLTNARERAPYSSINNASAIDDDDLRDLRTSTVPIERERKPYTAREGSGKVYEGGRAPMPNGSRVEAVSRPGRSNSTAPSHQASRPTDIPNSVPRSHRMSMHAATGPRFGTSPAQFNSTTKSESNISEINPSQYASNMMDYDDGPGQRDARRSGRRQPTDDDASGRGEPYQRGVPMPNHTHGPGSQGRYGATDGYGNSSVPQHQQPPLPPHASRH